MADAPATTGTEAPKEGFLQKVKHRIGNVLHRKKKVKGPKREGASSSSPDSSPDSSSPEEAEHAPVTGAGTHVGTGTAAVTTAGLAAAPLAAVGTAGAMGTTGSPAVTEVRGRVLDLDF